MSSASPVDRFKALKQLDQILIASGVLVFIFSFLPWYGVKSVTLPNGFHIGGGSVTAWHSYSTLALLLVMFSTAFLAVVAFSPTSVPDLPVGASWIVAGLSGLGALLELIRMLTLHHGDGLAIKWGGWLLLIVILINGGVAILRALQSGEAKPWENIGGATPPAPPAA